MKSGRYLVAGAAVLAAAVLALAVALKPPAPARAPAPAWRSEGVTLRGVFHLHTNRSDGTGTVDEVAAAAARAGLQFLILTDHGDAARPPDPPTYRSGVLCIDAVEISTTAGHYAAIGLGPVPYPLGGEPRDVVEDVRRFGGFGVVTHPYSSKPELAWHAWNAPFDAIEWLNGDSQWRDATPGELARAALTYCLSPVGTLTALVRRPVALARWDALARDRRLLTLAGSDAHARIGLRETSEPYVDHVLVRLPSYETVFRVASIRVWFAQAPPKDPVQAAAAIESAIRAGHMHSVVDGLAAPAVFDFTAQSGSTVAHEGDQLPVADPVFIQVRANLPPGASIVLFRNGALVHRVRSQALIYASNLEGAYRAEVWLSSEQGITQVPWVVSNPIYVGLPPTAPAPAAFPQAPADALSTLGPETRWHVESDARSRGAVAKDGDVVGLRYRLAGGLKAGQFAALAGAVAVPASARGLTFVARAERPMRVSVQLREGRSQHQARWERSVYLEPDPHDIVVPLDEMIGAGGDDRALPPRTAFRSILFVVDTVNASPGSAGFFALRDIRFYR
jgi:hypothetical protein